MDRMVVLLLRLYCIHYIGITNVMYTDLVARLPAPGSIAQSIELRTRFAGSQAQSLAARHFATLHFSQLVPVRSPISLPNS